MENSNEKESKLIVQEVSNRRRELIEKAEESKAIANKLKSKKVVLGTIIASMVAGALVGEYEVVAHGAEAVMPAIVGGCGALGGAIASGVSIFATNEQAKIDEAILKEDSQSEMGR